MPSDLSSISLCFQEQVENWRLSELDSQDSEEQLDQAFGRVKAMGGTGQLDSWQAARRQPEVIQETQRLQGGRGSNADNILSSSHRHRRNASGHSPSSNARGNIPGTEMAGGTAWVQQQQSQAFYTNERPEASWDEWRANEVSTYGPMIGF